MCSVSQKLQICSIVQIYNYICTVYVVGEWEAPLDKNAFRPDQLGSHAFSKFDSHRAVLFGGNGSLVYSNTCYIFNLDTRVRGSQINVDCSNLTCAPPQFIESTIACNLSHARNGVVHTTQTTRRSHGQQAPGSPPSRPSLILRGCGRICTRGVVKSCSRGWYSSGARVADCTSHQRPGYSSSTLTTPKIP